jgi:hypothetical protein
MSLDLPKLTAEEKKHTEHMKLPATHPAKQEEVDRLGFHGTSRPQGKSVPAKPTK